MKNAHTNYISVKLNEWKQRIFSMDENTILSVDILSLNVHLSKLEAQGRSFELIYYFYSILNKVDILESKYRKTLLEYRVTVKEIKSDFNRIKVDDNFDAKILESIFKEVA